MKTRIHYQAEWRAKGLCLNCGMKRPEGEKNLLCPRCAETVREWKRQKRARVKAAGCCYSCGRPKGEGWTLSKCRECLVKMEARRAALRAERAAAGLCRDCGQPVVSGRRLCKKHAEAGRLKARRRSERFHAKGLCIDCGNHEARPGRKTCADCVSDERRAGRLRRRQRIAAGFCPDCGKQEPSPGRVSCQSCRDAYNAARQAIRDRVFEAYGGPRCACCGETTREFLQIDHIGNDGKIHRKFQKSARAIYNWLHKRGFPPGFQVLCANCNLAKGRYGYCPHQRANSGCSKRPSTSAG